MNEDRCVCCGAIIPEGSMVCLNCMLTVKNVDENGSNDAKEESTGRNR